MAQAASRFEIGLLYVAGIVQGLALVTFPAASAIFVDPAGFALSGTQYGAMFIPQVVLAILTSALAPGVAGRIGLRGVLLIGLCGDLAAMALLAASPLLMGSPAAFVLLCVATGALGVGFGATVMALNTLVEGFSGSRVDSAILTLNALLGLGTALAPVLIALFTRLGAWWALPATMSVLTAALIVATLRVPPGASQPAAAGRAGPLPPRFYIYAGAVLLYGIVETLSGNWAALYLSSERHVSAGSASFALTAFWLMVTIGRVLVAGLARIVPAKLLYVALPVLLAVSFQAVALASGPVAGIVAFAAAGLACSAILPLSISFSGAEFPARAATMSGELIAIYQIGYGIAAFGVGPLIDARGIAYSSVFSAGSLVAAALALVAYALTRGVGEDPATGARR